MHLWLRAVLACLLVASLVVAGLGQAAPVAASNHRGEFVWPAEGRITNPFGCVRHRWYPARYGCRHFHSGIDIANKRGTPIVAANSGVVKIVGWNPYDPPGRRAWVVVIEHDAGFTGWYGHLQAKRVPGVRKGRRVKAGQLIGYMGDTGKVTGVHLHFSFMRNGRPIDPARFLPPWPGNTSASRRSSSQDDDAGQAPATADVEEEITIADRLYEERLPWLALGPFDAPAPDGYDAEPDAEYAPDRNPELTPAGIHPL